MIRDTKRTLSPTSHISLDVQMKSHADPAMLPTRSVFALWFVLPSSVFRDSDGSHPASRSAMINYTSSCVIVVEPTFLAGDALNHALFSSLPKTLFTPTLTCLLLAHNLLTDLQDGLFTLPNLQTLDVSFNSIAIIPPSISQLTSLVKVNFGFNKIKIVPNELFRLPTPTRLILSHNKLTSLPSDPAMSPNVELSLGFVDLLRNSMIYEKTGTGTHPGAVLCPLERLLLASNQLTSLPPLVSQFRKFHTLSLAGNGISELQTEASAGNDWFEEYETDLAGCVVQQRFNGTCTAHTPATSTLASPVALTLDGSGSRPYWSGRGMETPMCQFGHLNNADSSRTIVEQDGNQMKTERAGHPHFNQLTPTKNKKYTLLVTTRTRTL
ncbi:hypothetical protein BLNAU_3324 [Blattamonas nauphoetae]|uniref:Uncharacterized protein n=1 Tax=Blattamonas nauphoetae TaxID=2049346 RepID=A0ABQ9YDP2_9EUKA|nr:hypothetical protein BLNAU_3324 [Blattamonas nauphoetae]